MVLKPQPAFSLFKTSSNSLYSCYHCLLCAIIYLEVFNSSCNLTIRTKLKAPILQIH